MYKLIPLVWLMTYLGPAALAVGLYSGWLTVETIRWSFIIGWFLCVIGVVVYAHGYGCWVWYKVCKDSYDNHHYRDPDTSLGG